jgi:hypothetical protein
MTAVTLPSIRPTRSAFWLTAAALVAAALALTVWLVARSSSSSDTTVSPGSAGSVQYSQNQVCAPAPGTRYC